MNHRNTIIISAIIISIFIIGSIIYYFVPKTFINFITAPDTVNISINNRPKQSIRDTNKISVKPGHYTIVVSQDEFDSYTKEIDIKSGQTLDFLVALKPLTDAAKKLLNNDRSQFVIESFTGNKLTEQTQEITKKYPILSILPIEARLYGIYACPSIKYPNDPTKIALCVDESQPGLDPYVLKDIESRGFKPADYEIIFSVTQ